MLLEFLVAFLVHQSALSVLGALLLRLSPSQLPYSARRVRFHSEAARAESCRQVVFMAFSAVIGVLVVIDWARFGFWSSR